MNKITILIMTLLLIFSLSACGGTDRTEPQNSSDVAVADNTDNGNPQNFPDVAPAGNTDSSIDEGTVKDGSEPQKPLQGDADGAPTGEPTAHNSDDEETSTADNIVALAESLIGAEYEWGAAGPDTFDNSGFVYYCFKENGIELPRKTKEMIAAGTAVEPEDLLPGDLVFFTYNEDGSASYVGIYIGEGQFIAENNENSPVCLHDLTLDYYIKIYVGARRYF